MQTLQSFNRRRKNMFKITYIFASLSLIKVFTHFTEGTPYIDIKQYCKAFDENFQPIICLIKNGTSNSRPNYNPPNHGSAPAPTQHPIIQPGPPSGPDYTDFEEDDDDECGCEVTCIPRIIHQRSLTQANNFLNYGHTLLRSKRTTTTGYRCRPCGTECSVATTRPPKCYCVIPTTRSECTCTATCASFRYFPPFFFQKQNDGEDDANCIFSVTKLEDWQLGEERPPYVCDCKKSKQAMNSLNPDFICICQRIPVSRDFTKRV